MAMAGMPMLPATVACTCSGPGPGSPPRGISLARERGWLLVWDAEHTLYLFNRAGRAQRGGRRPPP